MLDIMKLFVKVLNKDGYVPIHIANESKLKSYNIGWSTDKKYYKG